MRIFEPAWQSERVALHPETVTRERLAPDLRALGVRPGQTLLVHASLRRIGWVRAGAWTVVAALTDVLGPDGTLVAAAGTLENSLTSRAFREREPSPRRYAAIIRSPRSPRSAATRAN